MYLIDLILYFSDFASAAIRNVSLLAEPAAVQKGEHATLRCLYDLQGEILYSVKFYRGLREFYRYSPSELPTSKLFPYPGINVDVSLIYFMHTIVMCAHHGIHLV